MTLRATALAPAFILASAYFTAACDGKSQSAGESVTGYCAEVSNYASQCAVAGADPCFAAEVSHCPSLATSASTATLGARDSCFRVLACGDAGAGAGAACFQAGAINAAPTAAQTELALGYCASCPPPTWTGLSTSACATLFYLQPDSPGSCTLDSDCIGNVPGSCQRGQCDYLNQPGLGAPLLALNDAIAESVYARCVAQLEAGAMVCSAFPSCENTALAEELPTPLAACGSPDGG